jgi:hypothetical protein
MLTPSIKSVPFGNIREQPLGLFIKEPDDILYKPIINDEAAIITEHISQLAEEIFSYINGGPLESLIIYSKKYARLSRKCFKNDNNQWGEAYLNKLFNVFSHAILYDRIFELTKENRFLIHRFNVIFCDFKKTLEENKTIKIEAEERNELEKNIKKSVKILKIIIPALRVTDHPQFLAWFESKYETLESSEDIFDCEIIPFPEIKIINLTCDHLHL